MTKCLQEDYIPESLPCGKQINQNFVKGVGMQMQCCKTECPNKSNEQIDQCYYKHKWMKSNRTSTLENYVSGMIGESLRG
jgi:hypothetical protein